MSQIPEFKTLLEESDFWDTHSPLDFPDEFTAVDGIFVDARPKKIPVSIWLTAQAVEAAGVKRPAGASQADSP